MSCPLPNAKDIVKGEILDIFDMRMARMIFDNFEYFLETEQLEESSKDQLERFLISSEYDKEHNIGYIINIYKYSMGRTYGRKYTMNTSLQNLKKEIRNTICGELYYDFDYKNTYPVIFHYICRKCNIDCPTMFTYVENRENVLENLIDDKSCPYRNRTDAKFGILLYINGYESEYNNVFMNTFKKQFEVARDRVLDMYPKFRKEILVEYGTLPDKWKIKALSRLFQQWEEYLINSFIDFIIGLGYPNNIFTNMFDGVMFLKNEINSICMQQNCTLPELIMEFNSELKRMFPEGYFEIVCKELNEKLNIPYS